MHIAQNLLKSVIFLIIILGVVPAVISAEESNISMPDQEDQDLIDSTGGLLFNGTIDPESSVAVLAGSGISYTIPGNTPVGVLESLKKSGKITSYLPGDELMKTRGTLLIDEIGGLRYGNESGWFVKVNGKRLEDVVLADVMGLATYSLNEGDVVLYALGNPEGMVSDSVAYLTVTIGSIQEASALPPESHPEPDNGVPADDTTPNETRLDEDQQSFGQVPEEDEETTVHESPVPEPEDSGNQEIIYTGSVPLPSGSLNISTTGGDYDISAATPLGILQKLLEEGSISSIIVNDKFMHKGGILYLEGINDYLFTGDKTWFVVVNGAVLKDYLDAETDGLNIHPVNTGDEVGYYFGEPAKPPEEAEAGITITIE